MPARHRSIAIAAAAISLLSAGTPARAAAPQRVASLPEPSNLAFDARGRLWVTSGGNVPKRPNGVWLVPRRGRPIHVVRGLYSALGLTWYRGRLYVSYVVADGTGGFTGRVGAYWRLRGRRFTRTRVVVDGLPTGLHRPDSIVPGPGGRLYLGVGSEFDDRPSRSPLAGSVVSFPPSGRDLRIEATGLRNPYGLAFIPGTSRLLVSDNGRDFLGLHRPPEEVNVFDVLGPAPDLGFPRCFDQGGPACRGTRPPLVRLRAHAAPGALAARSLGPRRAIAYLAEFGSSFSANPTGGDVVAIDLRLGGGRWHAHQRRFATGFGRQNPLGAAIGPGGSLYVSLWARGEVVRFAAP